MAYPITLTYVAASTTYIAAAQTLAGAGALTLNGSGLDTASAAINSPRVWLRGSGFARPVSLTSTGDLSAVNFTIVGADIRGAALTETIAGPNNNTVATTGNFYLITSITANAAVATAVSAGIYSTGVSQWVCFDYQLTPVSVGLQVAVAGTINWTIKQTFDDVQAAEPASGDVLNHPDANLVAQTVTRQGNYSVPIGKGGTKVVVNSSSASGALVFIVSPAGIE